MYFNSVCVSFSSCPSLSIFKAPKHLPEFICVHIAIRDSQQQVPLRLSSVNQAKVTASVFGNRGQGSKASVCSWSAINNGTWGLQRSGIYTFSIVALKIPSLKSLLSQSRTCLLLWLFFRNIPSSNLHTDVTVRTLADSTCLKRLFKSCMLGDLGRGMRGDLFFSVPHEDALMAI